MKFDVETGQLLTSVSKLKEVLDRVRTEQAKMFTAIEELNGMWEGTAHNAFLLQCSADREAMDLLLAQLQRIIDRFETARESYDSCEAEVKDLIAAVKV